jgi:hypothetical protein
VIESVMRRNANAVFSKAGSAVRKVNAH